MGFPQGGALDLCLFVGCSVRWALSGRPPSHIRLCGAGEHNPHGPFRGEGCSTFRVFPRPGASGVDRRRFWSQRAGVFGLSVSCVFRFAGHDPS